ncbi:MAG: hypothetical protein ACLQVD_18580 [Capsulimonadaceae bacterium]
MLIPIYILLHTQAVDHDHMPLHGRVTISRVTPAGAPSEIKQWVAKDGVKVLWSVPAFDTRLDVTEDNITILGSRDSLLVVDKRGTIVARLQLSAYYDPRQLLSENHYIIYDVGSLAIARYNPRTEGLHVWQWIHDVRRVRLFDVRRLRLVWDSSELDVGIPLLTQGQMVEMLRIVNIRHCIENPRSRPDIEVADMDVKTRKVYRVARLVATTKQAHDILDCWLGLYTVRVKNISWRDKSVYIRDLDGIKYFGYTNSGQ